MPGTPRFTRSGSRASFEAYRAKRSERVEQPIEPARYAVVLIATCSGCERLAHEYCRPCFLVNASRGTTETLTLLNDRHHGGYVVAAHGDQPFSLREGWADWRAVPLTYAMTSGNSLAAGVSLRHDALYVELPQPVSFAAFARRLKKALSYLAFESVLNSGDEVAWRYRNGLPLTVMPRFSAPQDRAAFQRVDDLFVFDPWRDLALLAVRASAAAMEEAADHTHG